MVKLKKDEILILQVSWMFVYFVQSGKLLERGLIFLYFSFRNPKILKILGLEHPLKRWLCGYWTWGGSGCGKKAKLRSSTVSGSHNTPPLASWARGVTVSCWPDECCRGWDLPRGTVLVVGGFTTVDGRTREHREREDEQGFMYFK